jgi:hypothetical protein
VCGTAPISAQPNRLGIDDHSGRNLCTAKDEIDLANDSWHERDVLPDNRGDSAQPDKQPPVATHGPLRARSAANAFGTANQLRRSSLKVRAFSDVSEARNWAVEVLTSAA